MKKLVFIFAVLSFVSVLAQAEYVNGYFKKNGTYVNSYNRSDKNDTVYDNYSYKNNINPYTGEKGTNSYKNKTNQNTLGNSGIHYLGN